MEKKSPQYKSPYTYIHSRPAPQAPAGEAQEQRRRRRKKNPGLLGTKNLKENNRKKEGGNQQTNHEQATEIPKIKNANFFRIKKIGIILSSPFCRRHTTPRWGVVCLRQNDDDKKISTFLRFFENVDFYKNDFLPKV